MQESSAETRKCKIIGQEKPLVGNFHLVGKSDGSEKRYYEHRCLKCWAEIRRIQRSADLTASRAKYAAYRADNKEKANEANRAYRLKYREQLRLQSQKKRFESRERDRPYFREKQRIWREANRHQSRLNSKVQRAKRRSVKVERITKKQIDELRVKQRGRCAICRNKLTEEHIDHIVPIAKGGAHEIKNIQLTCPPCNQEKHDRHPIDYMQKLGFLL